MITMSHGERWRTPVSSDPPPSKTHHKSPGHTPRPRSPIYIELVGGGATDPPGPPQASEKVEYVDLKMLKRGVFTWMAS